MLSSKISPDLELRLLQPADATALFALVDANRERLREWLAWVDGTRTEKDSAKFIASALRDRAQTRASTSGIWLEGKLVGVIGHNRIDWAHRVAFPGYWLAPGAEGKGIMSQCCRAFFHHAFTQLKVDRVIIGVAVENARGQAIAQRLGFERVSLLRNAELLNGRQVDHQIYSLQSPLAGGAAARTPLVLSSFG